jgi:predicted DNA-binding transcriptional regulator AlpA
MEIFLKISDMAARYKVSPWTIRRYVERSILPQPRDLGHKTKRWKLGEVEAWERTNKTNDAFAAIDPNPPRQKKFSPRRRRK